MYILNDRFSERSHRMNRRFSPTFFVLIAGQMTLRIIDPVRVQVFMNDLLIHKSNLIHE